MTKSDETRTWSVAHHYKAIHKISAQYLKAWQKKVRKTELLRFSKSKKGHNSFKIWRNLTKRELDLWLITTKPYTKFQLNTSKHVEKKCGKLVISPRPITLQKFIGPEQNSNFICNLSWLYYIQNIRSISQSITKKSAEN